MKKHLLLIIIFCAIIFGLILPVGSKTKILLPFVLGTLLFFNFYSIDFKFKNLLRIELLVYAVVTLVIAPTIVYFTTAKLGLEFRIGLLLITATPVGIGSSVIVKVIEGDGELSLSNIVVFNILSIVSYPIIINLFFSNAEINIPVHRILLNLFTLIVIPFVLSKLIKMLNKCDAFIKKASKYSDFLIGIIIFTAISSSAENIKAYSFTQISLIVIIVIIIAVSLFTIGFVCGSSLKNKKTLAVTFGHKNTGLCIWVALTNFSPIAAIPATIYIIIHHIINSILIMIFAPNRGSRDKIACKDIMNICDNDSKDDK